MTITAAPPEGRAGLRWPAGRLLAAVDAAVAVLLAVGGLTEVGRLTYSAPTALGIGSCVVCTGSVAVRRRVPFTAALAAGAALTVYQAATNDPDGSFIAPAVVLVYYYAGRSAAERRAWKRLAALSGYALAAVMVAGAFPGPFSLPGALGAWSFALLPAVAALPWPGTCR